MKRNILPIIIIVAVVVCLTALFIYPLIKRSSPELDAFAACLTEKGVVMYGTESCSHCQNQKLAFGGAFKKINYVECTENIGACIAKNIYAYPTWTLADGTELVGEQPLEKLSAETGCVLPK